MALIADLLMVAGALSAGFYCFILSRRLTAFKDAESGIGHAVASLSSQVDELSKSIELARAAASTSNGSLSDLTKRAEGVAQRLELMVASMHDLPEAEPKQDSVRATDTPVFSTRVGRAAGL